MELYDSIFRRKSIRNYSEKKISLEKLRRINNYTENLNSLTDDFVREINILDREKIDKAVSGLIADFGKVEAPHYITVSVETEGNYLENLGFQLEFLVLKLTSMGIGTCWLGSHFDEDTLRGILDVERDRRIPAIIALGYPDKENAFRNTPEQASRKKISEIMINETEKISKGWEKILNAARLAPSAMNGQPWRYEIFDEGVHQFIDTEGGIVKKLAKKFGNLREMNHIDAGVALSHIKVAAEHKGKEVEFRDESLERDDFEYIISVFEE